LTVEMFAQQKDAYACGRWWHHCPAGNIGSVLYSLIY